MVACLRVMVVLVPTIFFVHFRVIAGIHWKIQVTIMILKTLFKVTKLVHFIYLLLVEDRPATFAGILLRKLCKV